MDLIDELRTENRRLSTFCSKQRARIERLAADNARLRAAIEWLMEQPWKSIDKDNMEFQVTVSCYVRDALRAALEPKP